MSINKTYNKLCVAQRLTNEIVASGLPLDPSVGARFYGVITNSSALGDETIVILYDDITSPEETIVDNAVAAHIPTPMPLPIGAPLDDDGKPYVRNEVRPLGKTAYFTCAGDDPVKGIGNGTRVDWNFADDTDIIVTSEYKKKIMDLQFSESVNVRGGFLSYTNSQDECMIDMGIICPAGQYYLDSAGVPHLATTDVWVNRYVNQFDMDGTQPGLYIDGSTGSSDIPPNYKMRFEITTAVDDTQSRGHVAIMMYRKNTVTFP